MEVYRGNKIKKLISKYCSAKNPKVLDIGCGLNNEFFKFKDYTGIDIRDYGLSHKVIFQNLNENTKLPFKDSTFDVVMATEFLEHIFRPDIVAKEINRVTKKSGVIMISLPNEFTLNCRIGFAMNAVLNKGFDLYSHKYFFNITKIDEFIKNNFTPVERELACLGHFWKGMPDFINDLMVTISPSLFAKSVIYACKKNN